MQVHTFSFVGLGVILLTGILMFDFYVEQHEKAHALTCKYFGGTSNTDYHYTLFGRDGGVTKCNLGSEAFMEYSALQEITDYPSSIALFGTLFLNIVTFGLFTIGMREVLNR